MPQTSPSISTPSCSLSSEDGQQKTGTQRQRQARICLRCGYQWFSRVENPAQCPGCHSSLWNTPRAQQLVGQPAPTRKGKARGGSFTSETSKRANRIKVEKAEQNEETAKPS